MATPTLPDEVLIQCMGLLPLTGSQLALTASCRALQAVARSDDVWGPRLTRDFPLVSAEAKQRQPPGGLFRMYRVLAKSRVRDRHGRRRGIGPAGVFGARCFGPTAALLAEIRARGIAVA